MPTIHGRWRGQNWRGVFFRAVLICAGASVILATPLIGFSVLVDLDHGGDEICMQYNTAGLGWWIEEDGKPLCKFMAGRFLFFWSAIALYLSPISILGFYFHRHALWLREFGPDTESPTDAPLRHRFFLNVGVCILLAFAVGGAWVALRMLEPDFKTGAYLCAWTDSGNALWSYHRNDGSLVHCALDFGELWSRLLLWSPLLLPGVALAMYSFYWWRAWRQFNAEMRSTGSAP